MTKSWVVFRSNKGPFDLLFKGCACKVFISIGNVIEPEKRQMKLLKESWHFPTFFWYLWILAVGSAEFIPRKLLLVITDLPLLKCVIFFKLKNGEL